MSNETKRDQETMLCFEVSVNGKRVVAGDRDASILSAITTYVAERGKIEFVLGGIVRSGSGDGDHVTWLDEQLRVGDEVTLRVVEVESADPPVKWVAEDPELVERERRRYYEQLKSHYES